MLKNYNLTSVAGSGSMGIVKTNGGIDCPESADFFISKVHLSIGRPRAENISNIGRRPLAFTETSQLSYLLGNVKTTESIMTNTTKPIVKVQDGKTFTNSLNIAEVFGKEHAKVMLTIDNLTVQIDHAKNGAISFFKKSTYNDNYNREQSCYQLTRDGFTLIAMGFTGKKALEFKLAYINAFNKMEHTLTKKNTPVISKPTPPKKENDLEKQALRDLIDAVNKYSITIQAISTVDTLLEFRPEFFMNNEKGGR